MNKMQQNKNHQSFNGFKYYLATKPMNSNEWHFSIKPFVVLKNYNHLIGQFLTTLWYNQLCEHDQWTCEVVVIRVAKGANSEEFKAIKTIMNGLAALGNGYDNYDAIVMHGSLDSSSYANGKHHILEKLQTSKVGDAVSIKRQLKMSTSGIINMTLQGSYNDSGECNITLTLPFFEICLDHM